MPISLAQADVLGQNNGANESAIPRQFGYKLGGGRGVLTGTSGLAIAAHSMGLVVPAGCQITRALYRVLTTFTSATDAATIALHVVAANDVVSAAAISTGTTWDATTVPVITIVTHTASTNLNVTADSTLTATVAIEAITAGKMVVFLEWIYFGDLALT